MIILRSHRLGHLPSPAVAMATGSVTSRIWPAVKEPRASMRPEVCRTTWWTKGRKTGFWARSFQYVSRVEVHARTLPSPTLFSARATDPSS